MVPFDTDYTYHIWYHLTQITHTTEGSIAFWSLDVTYRILRALLDQRVQTSAGVLSLLAIMLIDITNYSPVSFLYVHHLIQNEC